MDKQKQKPDKDPFIKYYLLWPLCNFWQYTIVDNIVDAWRAVSGAWWCEYCEKYHGRRVNKYSVRKWLWGVPTHISVCSLGRDAYNNKDQAI